MDSVMAVYISLLVILASRISSAATALCTCEEGQYCSDGLCKPCHNGTYRSDPVHDHTWCEPWSTRPDDGNYVIKKLGSATSDIIWACEDGYEEVEYSTDEFECVKMSVDSVTTTQTTAEPVTSLKPKNTISVLNEEDDTGDLGGGEIAGIFIGVISLILILIVVLGICWWPRIKRYMNCFSHTSAGNISDFENTKMTNEYSESRTPMIDVQGEDNGHTSLNYPDTQSQKVLTKNGNAIGNGITSKENQPLDRVPTTMNEKLSFNFFYSLIQKLGKEAYVFIRHLDNGDGKFEAKSTIEFKKEQYNDIVTAYTEACLAWMEKTPQLNHKECVKKALKEIGKQHLIDDQVTNKKYSNGAVGDQNSGGDSIISKKLLPLPDNVRSEAQADSKLYKFFYNLVEFIGVAKSEELLYLLPNENQFNVRNSLELLQKEHKGSVMSCVETFQSWKQKNPQIKKLKDIILPLLIEIKRNDAAEDEQLLNLMSEYDNDFLS